MNIIEKNNKIVDEAFKVLYDLLKVSVSKRVGEIGEDCVSEAQARAPILTGQLRSSARQQVLEENGWILTEVSFNTEYALKMHEGQYNLGPISANAGPLVGPKYITRAFYDNYDRYLRYFITSIRSDMVRKFSSWKPNIT